MYLVGVGVGWPERMDISSCGGGDGAVVVFSAGRSGGEVTFNAAEEADKPGGGTSGLQLLLSTGVLSTAGAVWELAPLPIPVAAPEGG